MTEWILKEVLSNPSPELARPTKKTSFVPVMWTYLDSHLDDAEYLDLMFRDQLGEGDQETGL
jgi:hypothetical protein